MSDCQQFPNQDSVYDNFRFAAAGQEVRHVQVADGLLAHPLLLSPLAETEVEIEYSSQGLDEW